jgi:acetyl esterase/lipase
LLRTWRGTELLCLRTTRSARGERLQYLDPFSNASAAGRPTGEHSEASEQVMLTGEHIARYFVWDAMRGIDYLSSRADIDPQRIGAFGCSRGGTVTAYLVALDSRVKAAGVACYITSFDDLLTTIGPQEAEQSIPGFIQQGFGFPDWVETAAPMPYAVISTTEDMFPIEGARKSVDESRRIYSLYGASDRLQWITGPGRHASLRPIYPQIIGFFMHWLEQLTETPTIEPLPPPPATDLLCTATGQVANSLGGATVFTLNRERPPAAPAKKPIETSRQLARFRERLAEAVRATATIIARPGHENPQAVAISTEQKAGYRVQTIRFPRDGLPGAGGRHRYLARQTAVWFLARRCSWKLREGHCPRQRAERRNSQRRGYGLQWAADRDP